MASIPSFRWIERETLRYQDLSFQCEMTCLFNPDVKSYSVVLTDKAFSKQGEVRLTAEQIQLIEGHVRKYLATKRFLGIPIGTYTVNFSRTQTVSQL